MYDVFTGKSDPYVKVKLGTNDVVKTDYKKRTLSPRFDESFDLMVYERSVEVRVLHTPRVLCCCFRQLSFVHVGIRQENCFFTVTPF